MTGEGVQKLQETPSHPRQLALRIYRLLRLLAVATAVILYGVAGLLSRHARLPYWAALPLVVLVIFALFAGLIFLAGPGLSYQASTLRQLFRLEYIALAKLTHFCIVKIIETDIGECFLHHLTGLLPRDHGLPCCRAPKG